MSTSRTRWCTRCRRWSGSGSSASRWATRTSTTTTSCLAAGTGLGPRSPTRRPSDPVLALFADQLEPKRPDCAPLAGKSTLNRLEHAPLRPDDRYHRIGHDPRALANLLVDLLVEAHLRPPKQIVLDLDATDDPLHGQQEGRFFHGYDSCYCYLPLYVFCGRHLLAALLRPSNIDASAGGVEEIAGIVARIRQAWPRVAILLRADSGFARDELMAWCETQCVDYVFGLARNARLTAELEADLAAAAAAH